MNKYVGAVEVKSNKKETKHTHQTNSEVKIEKRPNATGSLGIVNDEGCEHNDTREVLIEKVLEKSELSQLQKIMVYGDVINRPKFKDFYNKKR